MRLHRDARSAEHKITQHTFKTTAFFSIKLLHISTRSGYCFYNKVVVILYELLRYYIMKH